jgi:topoisomerase-4 subunit A
LLLISSDEYPIVEVEYLKGRPKKKCVEQINLSEFIDIKGWKARGNRLSAFTISGVRLIEKKEQEALAEGHDDGENPAEQEPLDEGGHNDEENQEVKNSEREHPKGDYFNTDNKPLDGKNRKEQLKLFDKVVR